jgi:hypothetical protein
MRRGGAEAMFGMDSPDRKPLRVVAFRPNSTRLECRDCGLRFSVDPENLADAFAQREAPTPAMIEAKARQAAKDNPALYLDALAETRRSAARFVDEQREKVLGPHRRAVAMAKPRKRQIRFPSKRKRE